MVGVGGSNPLSPMFLFRSFDRNRNIVEDSKGASPFVQLSGIQSGLDVRFERSEDKAKRVAT